MSDDPRRPRPQPSSSLLHQVRGGDPRGWERLVALVAPPVLAYLHRHGLQDADAQDVLQAVCVRLARYFPGYRADQPFSPWLFALVRSCFVEAHRRRSCRLGSLGGTDFLDLAQAQADPASVEDLEDFRLDLLRQAQGIVQREVPADEWEVFRRKVLDGEGYDTIATALGIPKSRAYAVVFRIKQRLRELLLDEGEMP